MTTPQPELSPIEDLIEEARAGRMVILVDDEDRENEGDLIIPACHADARAINFMATHGRGLICLALTSERVAQLGLPMMALHNATRHHTAFTVAIEAREGVTTGISASDRARTVAVAIDPACGGRDLVSPGHVFPLRAQDGGVLVRTGHTEAAVDIARLAGLPPSGVICEVMNDDGNMARLPDLLPFAARHGLKIGTIADLIAYRRRHDRLVERRLTTPFQSVHGGAWTLALYVNVISGAEHVVLAKGCLTDGGPVLVRMHALSVLDDVLGDVSAGRGGLLGQAMEQIAAAGRGVVVLLRETTASVLSERIAARLAGNEGAGELRDYGVGAQILLDMGVSEMILLSNVKKTIIGLEGYGLRVIEQRPISPDEETR